MDRSFFMNALGLALLLVLAIVTLGVGLGYTASEIAFRILMVPMLLAGLQGARWVMDRFPPGGLGVSLTRSTVLGLWVASFAALIGPPSGSATEMVVKYVLFAATFAAGWCAIEMMTHRRKAKDAQG